MSRKYFRTPQVTVILAAFDRRHLIQRAIDSVCGQSFSDWELLVVDDGGTDELLEFIMPYMQADRRIRYLRHQHRGLAFSRNVGIHAALGKYVTFLDSDDEYLPEHLRLRFEFIENNPNIDIIHGGVELFGPPETHFVRDALNPDAKIHISDCVVGSTLFGKKSVFVKSGGFRDLPYSAESEFVPRVSKEYTVQKVDFATYRYYTGLDDSVCAKVKRGEAIG